MTSIRPVAPACGFALLLSLTGCAARSGHLVSPDRGGTSWIELRSAHFVLETDLDPEEGARVSSKLEGTLAALSELGFQSEDRPKFLVEVAYFRSMAEYDQFRHGLSKGEFFAEGPHDFERRPVVLLQGDFGEDARTTVQHELTHMLARYYYPQLPVWL